MLDIIQYFAVAFQVVCLFLIIFIFWMISRCEVVSEYRLKLINVDYARYKSEGDFNSMLYHPLRYPARKMKKFIKMNRSDK